MREIMGQSISILGLGVRAHHILNVNGTKTVADLCEMSPRDLMWLKNCGESTVRHIQRRLEEFGLSLAGDTLADDDNPTRWFRVATVARQLLIASMHGSGASPSECLRVAEESDALFAAYARHGAEKP